MFTIRHCTDTCILTHLVFSTIFRREYNYFLHLTHEEFETHRLYETCSNLHNKQVAGMSKNERMEFRTFWFSTCAGNTVSWLKPKRWVVSLSLQTTLALEFSCSSASSLSKLNQHPRSGRIPNQGFLSHV